MERVKIDDVRNEVLLTFNHDIYCQDCIEKASQDFSEACEVFRGQDSLLLRPTDGVGLEELGYEFYNYVLGLMRN